MSCYIRNPKIGSKSMMFSSSIFVFSELNFPFRCLQGTNSYSTNRCTCAQLFSSACMHMQRVPLKCQAQNLRPEPELPERHRKVPERLLKKLLLARLQSRTHWGWCQIEPAVTLATLREPLQVRVNLVAFSLFHPEGLHPTTTNCTI